MGFLTFGFEGNDIDDLLLRLGGQHEAVSRAVLILHMGSTFTNKRLAGLDLSTS